MLSVTPWKPETLFRFLIGLFICLFGTGLAVSVLAKLTDSSLTSPPFWIQAINMVAFQGAILALVAYFLREQGLGWEAAFGFSKQTFLRAVVMGILVSVIFLPLAIGLNFLSGQIIESFGGEAKSQQVVQTLQKSQSAGQLIYFGIMAVVVAPVCEELLFRGVLYPNVKSLGYRRLAMWGSAILFGVIHNNLMSLVPLTLFGVVLVLLYERAGNLLAPITAHAFFNAFNFYWLVSE
jgi:membrane protease YdiL (CAAX protease family)